VTSGKQAAGASALVHKFETFASIWPTVTTKPSFSFSWRRFACHTDNRAQEAFWRTAIGKSFAAD